MTPGWSVFPGGEASGHGKSWDGAPGLRSISGGPGPSAAQRPPPWVHLLTFVPLTGSLLSRRSFRPLPGPGPPGRELDRQRALHLRLPVPEPALSCCRSLPARGAPEGVPRCLLLPLPPAPSLQGPRPAGLSPVLGPPSPPHPADCGAEQVFEVTLLPLILLTSVVFGAAPKPGVPPGAAWPSPACRDAHHCDRSRSWLSLTTRLGPRSPQYCTPLSHRVPQAPRGGGRDGPCVTRP